ncbi:MAG: DUF6640 family protein [Chloroflexota bacterium]
MTVPKHSDTTTSIRILIAKLIVTALILATGLGTVIQDWNETHLYNTTWPPHALFHMAMGILMILGLDLIAGYIVWFMPAPNKQRIWLGTALMALIFAAVLGANLFPMSGLGPGESTGLNNQITVAWVGLGLSLVAVVLARKT